MTISSIGEVENNYLTAPFSEEEIREAVWNCESYKSPGSDGVNFSFIKQFWEEVKLDFLGFYGKIPCKWQDREGVQIVRSLC